MTDAGKIKNCIVDPVPQDDYTPGAINSAKSAYTASLHIIFAHVADFHRLVVRIISEKYKIPEEEILRVVQEHPDYSAMQVSPVIQSLGYFDQADADAVLAESMPASMPEPMPESMPESMPEPVPKKRVVRRNKKKYVISE
jgi:hypothetical protein